MAESIKTGEDKMINLFDNYSEKSRDLHISLLMSGFKNTTVVIHDDGFLPNDVVSPIEIVLKEHNCTLEGTPRYFNEIEMPASWEIIAQAKSGTIWDKGIVRGKIDYAYKDNSRIVKSVNWYGQTPIPIVTDHYNQWGWKFAVTTRNKIGKPILTIYLTKKGKIILEKYHQSGMSIYHTPDGELRFFKRDIDLVDYCLKKKHLNSNGIIFNTLSTSFFVVLNRSMREKHYLFWQEKVQTDIPGNMEYILKKRNDIQILVQNFSDYKKICKIIPDNKLKNVHYLGYIFPFRRKNKGRKQILIYTASDDLASITNLINSLPDFVFNIAATTKMSSKLLELGSISNVKLFPAIDKNKLDGLLLSCDFYLDINNGRELNGILKKTFENNMLIMSFNGINHSRRFTADNFIFDSHDFGSMVNLMRGVTISNSYLEDCLQIQHKKADTDRVIHYRKLIYMNDMTK